MRGRFESFKEFKPEEELLEIRKKIKEAPIEEQSKLRRELIADWKEKFINQRLGIAEIQKEIEEKIYENPEITFEELLKIVKNLGRKYQLNEKQYQNFEKAIKIYLEKHQLIKKTIETFKKYYKENWKEELFKNIFSNYPLGKIELDILPMNIVFKCYDLRDFATTFLGKPQIIENLERIGGCLPRRIKNKKLKDLIVSVNLSFRKPEEKSVKGTIFHEERHTLTEKILEEIFPVKETEFKIDREEIEKNPERKNLIIQESIFNYLENLRKNFIQEDLLKQEILSYLMGEATIEEIRDYLFTHPKYDFLKEISNVLLNEIKEGLKDLYHPLHQRVFEILLKRERAVYFNEVKKILEVVEKLDKMPDFKNNRRKLVNFLSVEPLSKWQRLAKILENK
jgi:hypothetical protein